MFDVNALDLTDQEFIQAKIDNKTKPQGALGSLESLATQLALITGKDAIKLTKPTILVFAGDHGIAAEGISIAPSEVTQQMVLNFLNGGAAINCFCRSNQIEIDVIDAGILLPISDARLTVQSLGNGTHNFAKQAAMDIATATQGLKLGAEIAAKHMKNGSNVLGFGEMGIGNTASAAAIMSAITKLPVEECVGRGTGISDDAYAKKVQLIKQAMALHDGNLDLPLDIMASVGGFEIVQMTGAMLAVAQRKGVILVDGFITTAAAMLAVLMQPNALNYMVFCHKSQEKGHQLMLKHLDVDALLTLDLRLGEGTGAALAYPLLQAAASFYNDMASFEAAGIDAV
jgi:nicotinate-nucleotide--dimethylbenzimidazole phosphoribosyltransferase